MRLRRSILLVVLAAAAFGLILLRLTGPHRAPSGAIQTPHAPSPVRIVGTETLRSGDVAGSHGCGFSGCHPDITDQWFASAHHFSSFNNPFYTASIDRLIEQDDGSARARWCAACHDPALLLTDRFDAALTGEESRRGELAQEGVGCLICHAMGEDDDRRGNGGYTLTTSPPIPLAGTPLAGFGRALLRIRPAPHRTTMLRPIHERAELCMRCHKVSVPIEVNGYRWKRGQNEYDAWHQSGASGNSATTFHLQATRFTCIDCHMPQVPSQDQGHDDGLVASHRFAAANTALPAIRGDVEQLTAVEGNLSSGVVGIDIAAIERVGPAVARVGPAMFLPPESVGDIAAGEMYRLYVVVSNRAVGHAFPGGTIDSNEAWIRLRVTDAAGRTILDSGALDENLEIDENARIYRARLLDENGEMLWQRDVQDWVATAYSRTIPAGTADVARYRFQVDKAVTLPLSIEAELLYRKFTPRFTRWVFSQAAEEPGEEIPVLPITTMARREIQLPFAGTPEPALGPDHQPLDPITHRNDLGIALLLQGDLVRAEQAFRDVQAEWPTRPDGPLNLARVALSDGDLEGAETALATAAVRSDPHHPTLAVLWGRIRSARGDHQAAAESFARAVRAKPSDRAVLAELAHAWYLAGQPDKALQTYERILADDPESLVGHNGRLLALRAQNADPRSIEAAAEQVRRYKPEEREGALAGAWLRAHPAENRNAQGLWEYRDPDKEDE